MPSSLSPTPGAAKHWVQYRLVYFPSTYPRLRTPLGSSRWEPMDGDAVEEQQRGLTAGEALYQLYESTLFSNSDNLSTNTGRRRRPRNWPVALYCGTEAF